MSNDLSNSPGASQGTSAQPANLVEALASMGANLKREAREATDQFREHMAGVPHKAPALSRSVSAEEAGEDEVLVLRRHVG